MHGHETAPHMFIVSARWFPNFLLVQSRKNWQNKCCCALRKIPNRNDIELPITHSYIDCQYRTLLQFHLDAKPVLITKMRNTLITKIIILQQLFIHLISERHFVEIAEVAIGPKKKNFGIIGKWIGSQLRVLLCPFLCSFLELSNSLLPKPNATHLDA